MTMLELNAPTVDMSERLVDGPSAFRVCLEDITRVGKRARDESDTLRLVCPFIETRLQRALREERLGNVVSVTVPAEDDEKTITFIDTMANLHEPDVIPTPTRAPVKRGPKTSIKAAPVVAKNTPVPAPADDDCFVTGEKMASPPSSRSVRSKA